jgi:hypothetical protein
MELLFIAVPVLLVFLLFRFWFRQGYYQQEIIAARSAHQTVFPKLAPQRPQPVQKAGHPVQTESEKKGNDFEKFVIDRFDEAYFQLLEWRSDKIHNGIYPLASLNPDLEYRFTTRYDTMHFAVECKWRQEFKNDQLQWAKDSQLLNYRRFEHTARIPVFVIIGVGGSPSAPEEVYIVPLDRIQSVYLTRLQLKAFKRYDPDKHFYLSIHNGMLE